jgi:hypothetical protein
LYTLRRKLQRENKRKRRKKLGRGEGDGKRKSKDKVENAEGKRLIKWIEENKWEVLNGIKQGDEEGEWTYMDSRGETVIPYDRIVNEEAWERVGEFRIRERVESNHLEIALSNRRGRKERRGRGMRDGNGICFFFIFWSVLFCVCKGCNHESKKKCKIQGKGHIYYYLLIISFLRGRFTKLIICKSLIKRQIQCFNNISYRAFEFAISYRTLPGFVHDPLIHCFSFRRFEISFIRKWVLIDL